MAARKTSKARQRATQTSHGVTDVHPGATQEANEEKGAPVSLAKAVKIKLVPNEDGLGPSVAVYYLTKGLAEVGKELGLQLSLVVQNKRGYRLSKELYEKLSKDLGISVTLLPKAGVIQLGKKEDGSLDFKKTRENLLGYEDSSQRYADEEDLTAYDAVVSFGSPEILLAAYQTGKNQGRKIWTFEVFDHSWSLTFEKILKSLEAEKELGLKFDDDAEAQKAVKVIEQHEGAADKVYLFPEFLTAAEYYCHWKKVVGPSKTKDVKRFHGVLGGYRDAEREQERQKQRRELSEKLELSGLDENSKIVVIQAGGTPVWDNFLAQIIGECVRLDSLDILRFFALFSEQRVVDLLRPERTQKMSAEAYEQLRDLTEEQIPNTKRVRLLPNKKFPDWQEVYVAVDLIFSRAGGITVQDAVACRAPVVCVEEPGQWQTEKIRETCRVHGIAQTVWYTAFRGAAIGPVMHHLINSKTADGIQYMREYEPRTELDIARKILNTIIAIS
jgi:hypothetical protein